MPKINKQQFKVQGKYLSFDMYYNSTNGFYFKETTTIKSLQEAVKFCNMASTEHELITHMNEKLKEFHEKIKKSRKVIVIDYRVGQTVSMEKTGPGSYVGKSGWHNVSNIGLDYGLAFKFEVYMRVDAKETEYHRINEDGSLGWTTPVSKEDAQIDWTEEREQALIQMGEAANEAAKKLHEFMTKDDLSYILELGNFKLLGS